VTDHFLDASALVKRYVDETGSAWIRSITDPTGGHSILLAEISIAEVTAALAAKQRAPKGLTNEERERAVARFLLDCDGAFLLVPVNRRVIDLAVDLAPSHRLRGYDAVQLAAALAVQVELTSAGRGPLTFVAADVDLLMAGRVEGLATDNPLDHADEDSSG
jgi:predicted nucleic acid-binding protein